MAVLLAEPEAEAFARLIVENRCVMSALNVFEAEIVLRGRLNEAASLRVRRLVESQGVAIVEFDDEQARRASAAYGRFGKGFHRARLNLADYAAYALATSLDAPLLYKREDFARTDVRSAHTPD